MLGDHAAQREQRREADHEGLPGPPSRRETVAPGQATGRDCFGPVDRDRRSEQVSMPLDEGGLAHLAAWFETMLLSFGQQYFEPA